VEISKSGSSRSTLSPGFLSHLRSPVLLHNPRAQPGMAVRKKLVTGELLCGSDHLLRVGQKVLLERR
jgi:hypothetical protein